MSQQILVGTRRGVFIGERKSSGWNFSGPHLSGQPIYCINADTRGGTTTLYAGRNDAHWGPAIRISKDMGATWSEAEKQPRFAEGSNMNVEAVWQIVPSGLDRPGVLYAGTTPAALFRSDDHGNTWNEVEALSKHPTRSEWQAGGGGLCLHSILVDPQDSRHLVVGISAVGVFESFDEGASWALANIGLPNAFNPDGKSNCTGSCIHKIAFAPMPAGAPKRIYQQNHMGLFRRDGVGDWVSIQNNHPYKFGFPLTAHPRDPERAYVISLESDGYRAPKEGKLAIYRTSDGGQNWEPLRNGLPQNSHNGILRDAFDIDSSTPCGLYFGTNGGQVFASVDEGENWELAADLLPPVYAVKVLKNKKASHKGTKNTKNHKEFLGGCFVFFVSLLEVV